MTDPAALITTLILERPMCMSCIAVKTHMSLPSVRACLEQISRAVNLQQWPRGQCQVCGVEGPAVSINRAE